MVSSVRKCTNRSDGTLNPERHPLSQILRSVLQAVSHEQRLFLNFDHFMMFQIKAAINMTTHLIV